MICWKNLFSACMSTICWPLLFVHTHKYRRAVELARTQKQECDRKPLRVTLSDMAKIYNGSTSITVTEIPFQQKLLLCALIAMTKKSKKVVTVAVLYEEYKTLCEQRKLKWENETEFMSLCDILASCGILCLKKAKETRHTKVSFWDICAI